MLGVVAEGAHFTHFKIPPVASPFHVSYRCSWTRLALSLKAQDGQEGTQRQVVLREQQKILSVLCLNTIKIFVGKYRNLLVFLETNF